MFTPKECVNMEIIQLDVFIEKSEPRIYRVLQVEKETTLFELHHIIQIAFGWGNYSAFEFDYNDFIFGESENIANDNGEVILDARKITLDSVFVDTRNVLRYTYDFRARWIHYVVFKRFLPKEDFKEYPYCISGRYSSPPGDSGGIIGYNNMVQILRDKKHPEYIETKKCVDINFEPNYFYKAKVNKKLSGLDEYISDWLSW